jgi:hypothetical protein
VAFWQILVDQKPFFGYTSYTVNKQEQDHVESKQTIPADAYQR